MSPFPSKPGTAPTAPKTLVVVYGVRGGMSDVGKFAVRYAGTQQSVTVRAVALFDGRSEAGEPDQAADVTDASLNAELVDSLRAAQPSVVDVSFEAAGAALETAVRGADAVVCAFSSRQPELPRYLALGMGKVLAAIRAGRTEPRLVVLSSLGIGDDLLPLSAVKVLWACLLGTCFAAPARDLRVLEQLVEESGLDYALLRPTGLTPEEPPTGSYAMLTERGQRHLELSISKPDAARCCVDEALHPTIHRAAATVGGAKST